MTVPYTFANQSGKVPASELDANFSAVGNLVNSANIVVNNAQPRITSVGTLTNLSVAGNVVANTFVGCGAQITGVIATAIGALPTLTVNGNIVSTTGYYIGCGSQLTNVTVDNVGVLVNLSVIGNVRSGHFVGDGSQLTNVTGLGTLSNVTATGNITAGQFVGNGSHLTNVTATGVGVLTNLTATGTVTAGQFVGNGSQLTNVVGLGTLSNVTATGTVTATAFHGNGSQLTSLPNQVAGANTQVQFNNSGSFGASANLTFNTATSTLSTANVNTSNITSNSTIVIQPSTSSFAFGTDGNLTLPNCSTIKDNSVGAVSFGFQAGATTGTGTSYAYSVAFSGAQYVSVGYNWETNNPSILSSPDGSLWTSRPIEFNFAQFQSVIWANNLFLAVGYQTDIGNGGVIATSPDGVTWTIQTLPYISGIDHYFNGVAYGAGKFVAVGFDVNSKAIMLSSTNNGVTWTQSQAGVFGGTLQSITWTGTEFVAVGVAASGKALILTSPDGLTWTQQAAETFIGTLYGIEYNAGQYVAVGFDPSSAYQGIILTSSNGISWIQQSIPLHYIAPSGITYGNGKFVVSATYQELNNVGQVVATFPVILSSTNGISWNQEILDILDSTFYNIIWTGSNYVTVGSDFAASSIAYASEDGINWSPLGPVNQGNTAVAFGSQAGQSNQQQCAIAIGTTAGQYIQQQFAIAVGYQAGGCLQGEASIAIGRCSGQVAQGGNSIALGAYAGSYNQGCYSIAIGIAAGASCQGNNAIAIGTQAGWGCGCCGFQPDNTIIINATGSAINGVCSQTCSFYVAPIRACNCTSLSSGALYYCQYTTEVTYGPIGSGYGNSNVASYLQTYTGNIRAGNINVTSTISAAGNIVTSGYFVGNFSGNISGNLVVPGSNTQVLFNNNGNAGATSGLTFNATSNILATTGTITAVGNVTGGNLKAIGNIQGNYVLGNGAFLSGVITSVANINNGTSNVSIVSPGSSVTVGVNGAQVATFFTTGMSLPGNVTVGNVNATNISGNGAGITNLPGTNRTTVTVITPSLAANAAANVIATGYPGYALYSISSNVASWITLYTSNAAAASDYTRSINTDPTPGSGVIAESIGNVAAITKFTPAVVGFNDETVPTSAIPMKIVNNGNVTSNISVTLTLLKLEG